MVNVFSFCLYGPPNPRYYPLAMIQNINLIGTHFPGWKVYIYSAPDVDPGFLSQVAMYSNVVVKPTGKLGAINMIERFFAIEEEGVEVMFVRDADSRVHWRDRWAIRDFLAKPEFIFHTIRDHKDHTAAIMGGLWGMRKTDMLSLSKQYAMYLENPVDRGFGCDQSFLSVYIYGYVRNILLAHVGGGAKPLMFENAVQIPFATSNSCYCGRVESLTFKDASGPVVFSFLNTKQ
jgi:hypothetical protein